MDSLLDNNKSCLICRTTENLHKHHVFGGANRKLSEQDGCWCYLCGKHHNLSSWGVHFNRVLDLALKRRTQTLWEEKYKALFRGFYAWDVNMDELARDAFIRRYGKSWIEGQEDG